MICLLLGKFLSGFLVIGTLFIMFHPGLWMIGPMFGIFLTGTLEGFGQGSSVICRSVLDP